MIWILRLKFTAIADRVLATGGIFSRANRDLSSLIACTTVSRISVCREDVRMAAVLEQPNHIVIDGLSIVEP